MRIRLRLLMLCAYLSMLAPAGLLLPGGSSAAPLAIDPGTTGLAIHSTFFDAQQDLLLGDPATARMDIAKAVPLVQQFAAALVDDRAAATTITDGMTAATAAVAANDQIGLASARGRVWTAMLAGAYHEVLASVRANDAKSAASWLLVREFRPTTKFARPGADATLAVKSLGAGTMTPDQAVLAVNADLLDTYQSKLDTELTVLSAAADQKFGARQAESAATIHGYWSILSSAYQDQLGASQLETANATVTQLLTSVSSGDAAQIDASVTAVTSLSRSFRAAPLSDDEKARRAGQLMRYLSLVPVEYGRGVKNGTVILDIEIQEAQTFLTASQASFDDLHLYLEQQDKAKTDQVEGILDNLDRQITAAANHTEVASPDDIRSQISDVSDTLDSMFPSEWTRSGGDADFDVIGSLLDQMEVDIKAGNWDQAESARLEAYAIYEVGAEKRLLAFAPDLANRTEQLFWQGTGSTPGLAVAIQQKKPLPEIQKSRNELDVALADGQERLGAGRPETIVVIFNAATIVFREGLEAVLILASLIASMVGANQKFKKPLALGALAALLATAGLFILADTLLGSLAKYGEKLEAIVSLIAIAILLVIMNWFFHKVYWTRWIGAQHKRRRAAIGVATGQVVGLVTLGFTSIFREGAESVLFLQALVLDAGAWVVIQGTLLGLGGTAVVGVLVFALQKKLPHKKMLMVTGGMIALVLVVMVGNTVHVMQIVGWLPITAIPGWELPYWVGQWFGVYPIWESLVLQALSLVVVLGSYFGAEFVNKREQRKLIAIAKAEQQSARPAAG
ncbi:MAG TPA: FTR1 family protein [Thermomicrobiales bacterium]|nr:FTR1 family protein [Thermomicrobiales bacterium]